MQADSSLDAIFPASGIGTAVRSKAQTAGLASVLVNFLESGGRLIDTAPSYGRGAVLTQVGKALSQVGKQLRSRTFVVTKIPPESMGYDATTAEIKRSLDVLRTNYIDAVLIHRPHRALGHKGAGQPLVTRELRLGSWRALLDAKRAGLIAHAGVANWGLVYLNEMQEAGLPLPAINELEFSPWVDDRQRQLVLHHCARLGIRVIAYNSLGGGAVKRLKRDSTVRRLAYGLNSTSASLLLRHALSYNLSVIPQASSLKHVRENLGLEHARRLTFDELRAVEADKQARAVWPSFDLANSPHRVAVGGLPCESSEALTRRLDVAMAAARTEAMHAHASNGPRETVVSVGGEHFRIRTGAPC